MTTGAYFYDRAPSEPLRALLSPGGLLEPLTGLGQRKVSGLRLDVHFRANDEVHVYCGRARLMVVRPSGGGAVLVTADDAYGGRGGTARFLKEWNVSESDQFRDALSAYLDEVKAGDRHTEGEGRVQSLWAQVREPWIPFDREAVLGGGRSDSERLRAALTELQGIVRSEGESSRRRDHWSPPPSRGRQIDQLAIDAHGRLVLVELKDASKRSAAVYYAPFQLLQYVWEWHDALECVRGRLQALLDARVALGLTDGPVPRLTGGIRAAVCFGVDRRTPEVRQRYERVLDVADRHLPPCVPRIETWVMESRPEPVLIAGCRSDYDPHRGLPRRE